VFISNEFTDLREPLVVRYMENGEYKTRILHGSRLLITG
jgi:hypothetical protein